MKNNVRKHIDRFPNVKAMLASIPSTLWDIFLQDTPVDLHTLEMNIVLFRKRERERDQVISIQCLCGLPLRPNDTITETKAKARIQGKKGMKLFENYKRKNSDDSDETSFDQNSDWESDE